MCAKADTRAVVQKATGKGEQVPETSTQGAHLKN